MRIKETWNILKKLECWIILVQRKILKRTEKQNENMKKFNKTDNNLTEIKRLQINSKKVGKLSITDHIM